MKKFKLLIMFLGVFLISNKVNALELIAEGPNEVKRGNEFEVSVKLKTEANDPYLQAVQGTLQFDNTKFEYVAGSNKCSINGWTNWIQTFPSTGCGVQDTVTQTDERGIKPGTSTGVYTIKLKVKEDAGLGETTISFSSDNLANEVTEIGSEATPHYPTNNKSFTLEIVDGVGIKSVKLNSGKLDKDFSSNVYEYIVNDIKEDEFKIEFTMFEGSTIDETIKTVKMDNDTKPLNVEVQTSDGQKLTYKFTLNKAKIEQTVTDKTDKENNPQTGINMPIAVLLVILAGGISAYVYSRKHNQFPNV